MLKSWNNAWRRDILSFRILMTFTFAKIISPLAAQYVRGTSSIKEPRRSGDWDEGAVEVDHLEAILDHYIWMLAGSPVAVLS